MKDYLHVHAQNRSMNGLLKAVLKDLSTEACIAGTKAHGLISLLVTEPLWCIMESKGIHIMDRNMHYTQLVSFFEDATFNISNFKNGDVLPFPEEIRKDSSIGRALLSSSDYASIMEALLSVLLPAMGRVCKHLYADHLTDGKWQTVTMVTRDIRKETVCVPTTNKFAKTTFGMKVCFS